MKGSCLVLLVFSLGVLAGRLDVLPAILSSGTLLTGTLWVLLLSAGMSIGFDTRALQIVRVLKLRVMLVPLTVMAGTFAGCIVAFLLLDDMSLREVLTLGAGFGYYSLSSMLITELGDPMLGSTALLCNVMRELLTLLGAPLMVRYAGKLAPVSSGGAGSMDTCLPVIARYAGEQSAVLAVFSGVVLTMSVPFLVSFFFAL